MSASPSGREAGPACPPGLVNGDDPSEGKVGEAPPAACCSGHPSEKEVPLEPVAVSRAGYQCSEGRLNSARFGLGFGALPDAVGGTAFCQLGLFRCLSSWFFSPYIK